jgi:arginyl-tRNA synthetase
MAFSERLEHALWQVLATMGLSDVDKEKIKLERPANAEHGSFATNAALVLSRTLGRPPREIASQIQAALLASELPYLEKVEVAGPGFVNVYLAHPWLWEVLQRVVSQGEGGYARPLISNPERVQVEFVSANPTGPLHVGNGWWGALGDSLARLLQRCGHQVSREYYVNDTGAQIRLLGESLVASLEGRDPPEGGYKGAYIAELARVWVQSLGKGAPLDAEKAGAFAVEELMKRIRATLERLHISFDVFYSQLEMEQNGLLAETLEALKSAGYTEERDGALWLLSSQLGDSRDRVLVRANGEPTYLAADLAYHRDKLTRRGFERVIDVFGADHHGQVPSLRAGLSALGIDPSRLEVVLGQLVAVKGKDVDPGRLSKREGNLIEVDWVVDLIGADAFRLLALVASSDQARVLDLDLVREASEENPVFYVQYAHARIASIQRVAASRGIFMRPLEQIDLSLLVDARELDLLRCLEVLPEVVAESAAQRAPWKVYAWVRRLAASLHSFYHDCRVMGDEVPAELTQARLALVEATRIGLRIGLDLLGVEAPDSMLRENPDQQRAGGEQDDAGS